MKPFPVPEIQRVALESVALSVKVMHGDVKVRARVVGITYTNNVLGIPLPCN
jgi:hypothetical protein